MRTIRDGTSCMAGVEVCTKGYHAFHAFYYILRRDTLVPTRNSAIRTTLYCTPSVNFPMNGLKNLGYSSLHVSRPNGIDRLAFYTEHGNGKMRLQHSDNGVLRGLGAQNGSTLRERGLQLVFDDVSAFGN